MSGAGCLALWFYVGKKQVQPGLWHASDTQLQHDPTSYRRQG
jgi:hypothetical protein